MGWKTKLLLNTAKALLPFRAKLRHLKRRFSPYQTEPEIDSYAFQQGLEMVQLLKEAGVNLEGKTVLELGTGWHPLIPMLFYIAGSAKIFLTDLERLTDIHLVRSAISYAVEERNKLCSALAVPEETIIQRFAFSRSDSLEELLSNMNMQYIVPYDPSTTQPDSLDIIVTRAVLEHIPAKRLENLLANFRVSLRRDGIMCHVIDESDHWEHEDKKISRVNFLKFSDMAWSLTGINKQNYQNRLRHHEYLAMFARGGFEIVKAIGEPDQGALRALREIRVCRRYRNVPHEGLAVLTSYIVARPS